MKTITESILFMALSMLVALFCVLGALLDICTHSWWNLAINILLVCVNVWFARKCYKRAKRLEEYMKKDIRTLLNLQLFDLMRHAFERHPDAFSNGFGSNTKDKEDEVEEGNGTPV